MQEEEEEVGTWVLGLSTEQSETQGSLDVFVAVDGRSDTGEHL